MVDLKISLLGPPHFERAGAPVEVDTRKALALLAFLALSDESHHRDELATMLWPNHSQSKARAYLRRALWTLKKGLTETWLDITQDQIGLVRREDLWVDVVQFDLLLTTVHSHHHPADNLCPDCLTFLTQAVTLYRGDFLSGFTLADSPLFDEWQRFQAERLRQALATALETLTHIHNAQGAFDLAIPHARRWLSLDPLHEPAHQQLMLLYAQTGQQSAALRQYQECARLLEEEFAISPSSETTALYEQIRAGKLEPRLQAAGSPVTLLSPSFPFRSTPFIGREEELKQVTHLLLEEPACRLLTLVGPGGIGKTRLAIEAAVKVQELFAYDVCFVPLASIEGIKFLAPAIGDALRLPLADQEDPRRQLINFLNQRQMILVLDNFEHLLAGVDLISDILLNVPHLKLLVTSRERLNLQGEWVLTIEGLDVPLDIEPDNTQLAAAWTGYSAVQLFLQHARQTEVSFSPSGQEQAIGDICRLVEGMPLALELAAAWVKMFSCQEIAQEIGHSLDFLTTSLQDVPGRHRSLRAVFEHSWQLLTETEKGVFKKLSVFQGGFRQEAAEQVAEASLLLLATFVDKSLIRRNPSKRYELHELLKQYGAAKLAAMPQEREMVQERHSRYYLTFLQQREDLLKGQEQKDALAEIAAEIDNVRLGWRWVMEPTRPLATITTLKKAIIAVEQAANSLTIFYTIRSDRQGLDAFEMATAALETTIDLTKELTVERDKSLGIALARQGYFCYRLGLREKAIKLLQKSLTVATALGTHQERAFTLNVLGNLARESGNFAQARHYQQQGILICKAIADEWLLGIILSDLGNTLRKLGEYSQAKQCLQESYSIFKAFDNPWGMARAGSRLGYILFLLEEYLEAEARYQESLVFYEEIDDVVGMGTCTLGLGNVAYAQAAYHQAAQHYRNSLATFKEIGAAHEMTFALNGLGNIACVQGAYEEARLYFHEALKVALDIKKLPMVLDVIVGLATLLIASKGYKEQAVELLVLAGHHPVGEQQTRDRAAQLLAELASDLPPKIMSLATTKAKGRKLETVVSELLREN